MTITGAAMDWKSFIKLNLLVDYTDFKTDYTDKTVFNLCNLFANLCNHF